MGFIESTYSAVNDFLAEIGETQFIAVAEDIAGSAQILATIVAIVVVINMSMQYRPIDMGTSITLIWKMILVAVFLQNWTQFDALTSAFFDLMESVSTSFLSAAAGSSGPSPTSFAASLDDLTDQLAKKATIAASSLNIVGMVVNGLNLVLIAIFGAISMIAMVTSRVVLTVLIALGPLAIMASLAEKSKNIFESWASGMMAMLLFPVLIAGVFGTIVGMARISIPTEAPETIGDLGPIMMTMVSAIILVIATPFILTVITGKLELGKFGVVLGGRTMSGLGKALGVGRSGIASGANTVSGSISKIQTPTNPSVAATQNDLRGQQSSDRGTKAAAQLERHRRMAQQPTNKR